EIEFPSAEGKQFDQQNVRREMIEGREQRFFSARLYFLKVIMIIDNVQPLKSGVRSEGRQVDRVHPRGQIEVRHKLAAVNEAHIKITQREENLAASDEMSDSKQRLAIKQHSLFHTGSSSPLKQSRNNRRSAKMFDSASNSRQTFSRAAAPSSRLKTGASNN